MNAKEQPHDHEFADTAPHSPDMDAPEDVIHNKAEARVSEKAHKGEHIADEKAPDKQKARELRALKDEELVALAKRATESEHWLDTARRSQAEFENSRKRLQREADEAARYAAGALGKEMLASVDNLDRALASAGKTPDAAALAEGVRLTRDLIVKALEKFGIRPIDALHQPFDPAQHEAVMMANDAKLDDNVVAQVFETGWTIHDRVLRPAKVVVNKKPK
ncbi:MAG: nucleotide exchange factor GrpE [Planctomycetes bacterium]|nr:nucleotide exchange factor GrpE [Planctomycetota bacterium]